MGKVNWKNISYLLIFIASVFVILHDAYRLTIEPTITGHLTTMTIYGLFTFALAWLSLNWSSEQIKSAWIRCTK